MKPLYITLLGIAATMLPGCGNDKFTPGPQDPEGCAGIYFPASNRQAIELTGDEDIFNLEISRLYGKGEVSVPLEVATDVPEGLLSLPSQITFADGETSAVIAIDLSKVPANKKFNLSIAAPEGMTTMYGEGARQYDGTLYKGKWEKLCGITYQSYYNNFTSISSTMETLRGLGKFRLNDYFGSGLPIVFETEVMNPESELYGKQAPFLVSDDTNADYAGADYWADEDGLGGDAYAYSFWVYDKKNEEYPIWEIEGFDEPVIYWQTFVSTDLSTNDASYIQGKSFIWTVNLYTMDEAEEDWNWDYSYIWLGAFDFNPYKEETPAE